MNYIREDRDGVTVWGIPWTIEEFPLGEGKRVKMERVTVTHPRVKYGKNAPAAISWSSIGSVSIEEADAFRHALHAACVFAENLNYSMKNKGNEMKTLSQLLNDASKLVSHTRLTKEPHLGKRPTLVCHCLNASTAANVACMMVLLDPTQFVGALEGDCTYCLPSVYQDKKGEYYLEVPIS